MNDKQTRSFIFHRKTDSCFPLHPGRTAGSRRCLLLLTLFLSLLQAGMREFQAAEDSERKAAESTEVYQTLYMDGNLFKELTNRISDTGLYVGSFSSCGQSAPLYIHKDGGDGLGQRNAGRGAVHAREVLPRKSEDGGCGVVGSRGLVRRSGRGLRGCLGGRLGGVGCMLRRGRLGTARQKTYNQTSRDGFCRSRP